MIVPKPHAGPKVHLVHVACFHVFKMVRGSRGRSAGRRQASSGVGGRNTTRSPAPPETRGRSAPSEAGTGARRARSRSWVRTAPRQTVTVPDVHDSSEHNRLGQLEHLMEQQAQTVNQLMQQVSALSARPNITPSTSAGSSEIHPPATSTVATDPAATPHNSPASSVVPGHPSSNPDAVATRTVDPAVLSSMAQGSLQGFNLSKTLNSIFTLGSTLRPEVKKAIGAGDYINLATLKPGHKNKRYSHTAHVDDHGASVRVTVPEPPPPKNFNEWLHLFCTYAAIFVQENPSQAPDLFTYIIRIADLERRHGGDLWRRYDERYRELRTVCKDLPWHTVHFNVVLGMDGIDDNSPAPFLTRGAKSAPSSTYSRKQSSGLQPRQGTCFTYWNAGSCDNAKCPYKHKCADCGSLGHSFKTCKSDRAGQPTKAGKK